MSTTATIDTLITSAQADQAALGALILQLKSETLRSDDLALIPAPLFDDATQVWTQVYALLSRRTRIKPSLRFTYA